MHEWQVYLDKFGVWRIVHVDNNWKIPNGTRVKEFKTKQQAREFTIKTANKMLWQQTDKRNR